MINSLLLSEEQKVVVLRVASMHPKSRHYFKSVGLVDLEEYETLRYMGEQMKKIVTKARETKPKKKESMMIRDLL